MVQIFKIENTRLLSIWCLLILFNMQQVRAQEANNCTECACPPGIFQGSCSVRCCKPKVPGCNCEIFSSRCSCVGLAGAMPELHDQNVRDFAVYLRTSPFSSTHAQSTADDLLRLLSAHAGQQTDLYYTIANRLEQNLRQLPATEKQLANQWIGARGGSYETIR
ncbi:MAG: hypothetical protein IT270_19485 [Saprospiraceae bacterium]|nr:hypothetical protein [Saprospiraceae bacterium]